jgi:hypothetical protein
MHLWGKSVKQFLMKKAFTEKKISMHLSILFTYDTWNFLTHFLLSVIKTIKVRQKVMYTMLVMLNGQADKEQPMSIAAVKNIALLMSYIWDANLFNEFWWKRQEEENCYCYETFVTNYYICFNGATMLSIMAFHITAFSIAVKMRHSAKLHLGPIL